MGTEYDWMPFEHLILPSEWPWPRVVVDMTEEKSFSPSELRVP